MAGQHQFAWPIPLVKKRRDMRNALVKTPNTAKSAYFEANDDPNGVLELPDLPDIRPEDQLSDIVRKLSYYIVDVVNSPHTWEGIRSFPAVAKLRPLIAYLSSEVHHPSIVCALLILKWHFNALPNYGRGVNETRGLACELIAWRYLTYLSERDVLDYVLYDLPASDAPARVEDEEAGQAFPTENGGNQAINPAHDDGETVPLMSEFRPSAKARHVLARSISAAVVQKGGDSEADGFEKELVSSFENMNALEIAVVADAKKFMSQRLVQRVIDGIWDGRIIFWESLSLHTTKQPHFATKSTGPFAKLRVPKYQKAFEVLFFTSFLLFYYIVFAYRDTNKMFWAEPVLVVWIIAFACDEVGQFWDAGLMFYATDFWSAWDLAIIAIGLIYAVMRAVGLGRHDEVLNDRAFDVLSLEALVLFPRICSLLSIHPYFGTLLPCLREMAKDFVKFLSIVAILYIGFLTTFSFLAHDAFTITEMAWLLIKVFFGSSYMGFDEMYKISPILGPPLMLIFVTMTNILLLTSLISLLSNSLDKIIGHAREEYLFIYSSFVLEASTSNRLTYFYPPFNLLAIVLLRPLRIFLPAESIRAAKISLLKATHFPFVLLIQAYEGAAYQLQSDTNTPPSFPLGPERLRRSTIRRNMTDSTTTLGNNSERLASSETSKILDEAPKPNRKSSRSDMSTSTDRPKSTKATDPATDLKKVDEAHDSEDFAPDEEELEQSSSADRETQELVRELLTRVNQLTTMMEKKTGS